jgi:hypothetical protein
MVSSLSLVGVLVLMISVEVMVIGVFPSVLVMVMSTGGFLRKAWRV